MVILLDRSRSMDGPFASAGVTNSLGSPATASKGRVARKLLSEFAARRQDDMFGMVIFSTYAIPVLGLVTSQEAVQAAIAAGDVGRGLAETNVGAGIEGALDYFEDLPYTGSRILLLVSDGAARLDLGARVQLRNRMLRLRVSLYWIYIRSLNSTGLFGPSVGNGALEATLHQFFEGIGLPYRAYMAENPEDIETAIADVGRLQNLPIHFSETSPRRELWRLCYGAALVFLVPLCVAGWLETRRWV
jgi:mxaC protein